MKIDFYSSSDIGDRENNEDALSAIYLKDSFLAIVADGVGGYQYGEIASDCAVNATIDYMKKNDDTIESLVSAVKMADREIRMHQDCGRNMMSTIAVLLIKPEKMSASVINVGDTRIYQFRNDRIIFQSIDHSIAQMAVYAGQIAQSEIRNYPGRNKLIRALGSEKNLKFECNEIDICTGDRFLLCSDGFWELITENIMIETFKQNSSSKDWLDCMKEIIIESHQSRKDNFSAITITIL